jgi:ABC-type lipopolysaccharide export system ATPase subunit
MSQLDNLRKYIRNQDQHHQEVSFQEELDSIIEEYKLQKMRDQSPRNSTTPNRRLKPMVIDNQQLKCTNIKNIKNIG